VGIMGSRDPSTSARLADKHLAQHSAWYYNTCSSCGHRPHGARTTCTQTVLSPDAPATPAISKQLHWKRLGQRHTCLGNVQGSVTLAATFAVTLA
jgi:hypothetical protein